MKTVIETAREAGFETGKRDYADGQGSHPYVVPIGSNTCLPELERFAELVRADAIANEREACAVMVEKEAQYSLAKAIRSRSSERRSKEQQ